MEAPASVEIARQTLMAGGLILAIGTVTGLLAHKAKIPDVAAFLIAGVLIGPRAIGLIDIKADSALNQVVLLFDASYVLFDGGASLSVGVLKQVWITIVALATVGVVITAAVTGVAAYFALGIPAISAALLGSAIAATDPATLIPIFRQVRIRDRVAQTLMSESAFNDATGAALTFAVLGIAMGTREFSWSWSLVGLLKEAALGTGAGLLLGYLAVLLIAHERWAFLTEYAPVVTLVAVVGAYFAADGLHASGFMAVFVFGIVLGNKEALGFKLDDREQQQLHEYITTTAFIMRLLIFLLLGSQIDFALVDRYLAGGIVITTIFMLIARPLAVFLCALPDRRAHWSMAEMLFMCWSRETGVMPAALAGLLLGMHAPGAQVIASVTYVAILMTILIQATTAKWLGKRLGLLEEDPRP